MQKINKSFHIFGATLFCMSLCAQAAAATAATAATPAAAAPAATADTAANKTNKANKAGKADDADSAEAKEAKDGKAKKTMAKTVKELMEDDAKEALLSIKNKLLQAEITKRDVESKNAMAANAFSAGSAGAAPGRTGKSAKNTPAPEPVVIPDTILVSAVFGSSLTGKVARVSVNNLQTEVRAGDRIGGYQVSEVGNGCVTLAAAGPGKNLSPGRHCFSEQTTAGAGNSGNSGAVVRNSAGVQQPAPMPIPTSNVVARPNYLSYTNSNPLPLRGQ
jgi:hypothetical protein